MHLDTLVTLAALCLPAVAFADTEVQLGNDALNQGGSAPLQSGELGSDLRISPPEQRNCEGDNNPNSRRKVCGSAPFVQCEANRPCAQTLEESRTYDICYALNKAQARFHHMGACEARPQCPDLNRIVHVDMEKVDKEGLMRVLAFVGGGVGHPRIGTHSLHSREDGEAIIFGIHPMEAMTCVHHPIGTGGIDPRPGETKHSPIQNCQQDMERIREAYERKLGRLRGMKGVQVHCEERARTMPAEQAVDDRDEVLR